MNRLKIKFMKTSIIIPTYNRLESLLELLDKLNSNNFINEVIISDDGSSYDILNSINPITYYFDIHIIQNIEHKLVLMYSFSSLSFSLDFPLSPYFHFHYILYFH